MAPAFYGGPCGAGFGLAGSLGRRFVTPVRSTSIPRDNGWLWLLNQFEEHKQNALSPFYARAPPRVIGFISFVLCRLIGGVPWLILNPGFSPSLIVQNHHRRPRFLRLCLHDSPCWPRPNYVPIWSRICCNRLAGQTGSIPRTCG
ncbi:hypothetical protein PSEUDO9AG_40074 [Pseudomonas sp. 9Ag]|nr:hypothetical protein PSEUDO9AG_40074 [Pseudomonas sp. 9Ag]